MDTLDYLYPQLKNKNPLLPPGKWFIPAAILFLLFFLLCVFARAEENWTESEIVQAIWMAEGGAKAQYAFGIRSVKYKNIEDARRICLRTIRNNRKRYADYGWKKYPDFLSFLASRYCPVTGKLSQAEKRLNGNWLRNVKYFLTRNRQKGEK